MVKTTQQICHYVLLFLAQLMVGVSIVSCKFLVNDFSVIFILVARFAIASCLLFAAHLVTRNHCAIDRVRVSELTKKDWFYLVVQALTAGALFNLFLTLGLNYTNASVAGIITSALPAVIALMSVIFLRERLTLFSALCIILSVVGLVVINAKNFYSANSSGLLGDFFVMLSLLPEGAYYLLVKLHLCRLPTFLLAGLMNAINLLFFLIIFSFLPDHGLLHLKASNGLILFVAGCATALFFVFWSIGCKAVSGVMSGLFTALMPISTLLIAWIFLGETITVLQCLGMLVIILAIFVNAGRLFVQEKKIKV